MEVEGEVGKDKVAEFLWDVDVFGDQGVDLVEDVGHVLLQESKEIGKFCLSFVLQVGTDACRGINLNLIDLDVQFEVSDVNF